MAIIIQRLNGEYDALTITKVQAESLSLGRAFSNSCILDEPHVSLRHLFIRATLDGFEISDLNSENGFRVNNTFYQPGSSTTVSSGDRVQVGKVRFRFFREDHPLPPTLTLGKIEQVLTGLVSQGFVALMLILLAVLTVLQEELPKLTPFDVTALASTTLKLGGVFFVWLGFWSLTSRLIKGESRFFDHLAIASIIGAFASLVGLGLKLIQFNYPSVSLIEALVLHLPTFWIALLIFFHVSLTHAQRGLIGQVLLFLCFLLTGFIGDYDFEEESPHASVNELSVAGGILPDWALWRSPSPLNDFVEEARELNATLNEPLE